MSLKIDNRKLGGTPDFLDFWGVFSNPFSGYGGHDFYPGDESKGNELDLLIADMRRINKQFKELIRLMPIRKHRNIIVDHKRACKKIELAIWNLMGNDVIYKP